MTTTQVPHRLYRKNVSISIIGLGGMVLVGAAQTDADRIVAEALDQGVNYFDVAPSYGEGEAEARMGRALRPRRASVFLACKTLERSAGGARRELEQSLQRLHTDHLDLYQLHAISGLKDVEELFASRGAMETLMRAQEEGMIQYIGFSAHSAEAALAMMDRFHFDSILFPVNYVCYARGNFGPQVLAKAESQGVTCLAIKAMAHGPWRKMDVRRYPNCWYRPIEDPGLARKALRFTLSENVAAVIPPGDVRLFRMALELATDLPPFTAEERAALLASARGMRPLMRA